MAAWLLELTRAPPNAVFVAIEVPHGPVVESLMERGFRVHSINPKQPDRFRDRFSPAGAKDDSRDAEVLADALRTDTRCLRELSPLDPLVVELREWSRIAEDLKRDRNRLGNRVRELRLSADPGPAALGRLEANRPPDFRWSGSRQTRAIASMATASGRGMLG